MPQFSKIVNSLFNKFDARDVKIICSGTNIIIRDEHNVNTTRDGGYQTFLNNLVYRIALSKINNFMETNFMIIDEAFDSADRENKNKIKSLIEYLRSVYDWVLIISHDDDVKDTFESTLVIKELDVKRSQISVK